MRGQARAPLIALLTDFGARDWYVAAMKGVILARAPRAQLVDITHEIPPQDILAGAFTLAAAAPWFPRGTVIVAVVDPGVGSARGLLAARCDGRYLLGPDNGVLALALQHGTRSTVIRLTSRRFWRETISRTFHGRDILAPVAAHLACGGAFAALGVPASRITPLEWPSVQRRGRRWRGRIVHIDAFGNLMTNLPGTVLASGRTSAPVVRYQGRRASVVSSYGAGAPNRLMAVVNALGMMELAVKNASAAAVYTARRGDPVEVVTNS